jgi:hypothetical protein
LANCCRAAGKSQLPKKLRAAAKTKTQKLRAAAKTKTQNQGGKQNSTLIKSQQFVAYRI